MPYDGTIEEIINRCGNSTWGYAHIQSGSGDFYEYEPYFPDCQMDLIVIIFQAILCEDGTFPQTEVAIDWKNYIREVLIDYDYEDDLEDKTEQGYQIAAAFDAAARQQDMSLGLSCGDVCGFLDDINEMLGEFYTRECLLSHLPLILPIFTQGCSDILIRIAAISSEEVYQYNGYRENVPEQIREKLDRMIDILDHPYGAEHDEYVVADDLDELGTHVVTIGLCLSSGGMYVDDVWEDDMNVFYEYILKTLDRLLPKLREEYGECVSAPRLFFVLF